MRCRGWAGSSKKRRHCVMSLGAPLAICAYCYIQLVLSMGYAPNMEWVARPCGNWISRPLARTGRLTLGYDNLENTKK